MMTEEYIFDDDTIRTAIERFSVPGFTNEIRDSRLIRAVSHYLLKQACETLDESHLDIAGTIRIAGPNQTLDRSRHWGVFSPQVRHRIREKQVSNILARLPEVLEVRRP